MKVLIAGQYGVFLGQLIDIFHKEGWEVYLLTGEGRPSRRRRNVFEQYYFRYDSESVRDIMDSASPDLLLFAGARSGRKMRAAAPCSSSPASRTCSCWRSF